MLHKSCQPCKEIHSDSKQKPHDPRDSSLTEPQCHHVRTLVMPTKSDHIWLPTKHRNNLKVLQLLQIYASVNLPIFIPKTNICCSPNPIVPRGCLDRYGYACHTQWSLPKKKSGHIKGHIWQKTYSQLISVHQARQLVKLLSGETNEKM